MEHEALIDCITHACEKLEDGYIGDAYWALERLLDRLQGEKKGRGYPSPTSNPTTPPNGPNSAPDGEDPPAG